jgi:DNA topoisomerase-1
MQPLIIVESYTKTKTIAKYLDNKYTVICSLGHICDLPKTNLGIDTDTWEGTYQVTKHKIIDNIRTNVRKASAIYLASDPDTEGEAIAHHIYNSIKDILKNKPCHRIKFHEITKNAVTKAINEPREINQDMVCAQEARRFIDRLVGYKLSPLLWSKFNDNTLSVGRVQSVALMMIVNMMQSIQEFSAQSYWNIIGIYSLNKSVRSKLEFKLCDKSEQEIVKIQEKNTLIEILSVLNFKDKPSITVNEKPHQESPSAPYTTTTLQQDAYTRHRFTSKKTMQLAQELYENGHITYMRTDSTNISNDFKNIIIAYVKEMYGEDSAKFRNYKNKIANAQEAHEAIRITNIRETHLSNLSDEHNKLYKLIWKRTVASQMINAEYTNLEIILSYDNLNYLFRYTKSFLISKGYLVVYQDNDDSISLNTFKESLKNEGIKCLEYVGLPNIDNPPSLYNEIGVIKALEKEGIGRPSTYTSIIDKLFQKHYVTKGQNPQKEFIVHKYVKNNNANITEIQDKITVGGKSKDLLVPTTLAFDIINHLKNIVPFLLDIHFTSKMESALDDISNKIITKRLVLDEFYNNHLLPICITVNTNAKTSKDKLTGIVKTKYGYCYYNSVQKKYMNIESYLNWRGLSADKLTDQDIRFLSSLPKTLEDGTQLLLGQYGLYIKDQNKNIKLEKSKWIMYLNSC